MLNSIHSAIAQNCRPIFLHPYSWCFCLLEIVISVLAIILNSAVAVCVYYSIPISVLLRRALAVISLNYAFVAALHLARNLLFIFSINYPCIHIVTTINCKLQEFPLVFAYIHCAILQLFLAVQALWKHRQNFYYISWTNACSIQQTTIIILCLGLALVFTAFDKDRTHDQLSQCSIMMAIREHDKAFWLLTSLICIHVAAIGIFYMACWCKGRPRNLHQVLIYEFRDFVGVETLFWEISLFFTGVLSVYKAIAVDICYQCLAVILEISFVLIPLFISFAHPFLIIWFVIGVRNASIRLCPIVSKIMPDYEMHTPPLPKHSPQLQHGNNPISISQILIRSPNINRIELDN